MTFSRVTFFAALLLLPVPVEAAPVLMISIDGLRPGDVLEADARGFKAPVLKKLVAEGVYASGVKNALPTVTYPNHTTLITGVWPAKHGIANNPTFDPLQKNMGGWYWYSARHQGGNAVGRRAQKRRQGREPVLAGQRGRPRPSTITCRNIGAPTFRKT